MDDSEQRDLPCAKRRKIDVTLTAAVDAEPVTIGSFTYLTLAQTTLQVEVGRLHKKGRRGDDLADQSVCINYAESSEGVLAISIAAPWLKLPARLTTKDDALSNKILNDCSRLPSAETNRSSMIPTCYRARLDFNGDSARLTAQILWHDTSKFPKQNGPLLRRIVGLYDPTPLISTRLAQYERWDVREFYDNVHVPQPSEENDRDLRIDLLHCQLFPFQKRAVRWMLSREGVEAQSSGQVTEQKQGNGTAQLPAGFHKTTDANNRTYYANHAVGVACSSLDEICERYGSIRGGLLAEAMGLGKTVEMLALMCLHKMGNSPYRDSTPSELKRSGATLIITPPSILEQWRQEIQKHTPSLRVCYYEGIKQTSQNARHDWMEELAKQDVVLTTYQVVAKEIHYVMERPDRELRNRPRRKPPRSPLDQILWWRVCLDEAQMIESGVSAAAAVAKKIPRVNAWAVTGTPLKHSQQDLYGLMLFLRYEPWCHSSKEWEYLVMYHRPMFHNLMNEIAIRHSKEIVREELSLPPQNRHTITIGFTSIEQAHYAQLFYDMCRQCGLHNDGSPASEEWDMDSSKTIEKMRSWLMRLRQTCLHPEVGHRNKRALGRNQGPLRTVAQVLEVMMDQTEGMLRTEQRNMLAYRVRQGQIQENAKCREEALRLYTSAYEEASTIVDQSRSALAIELAQRKGSEQQQKDVSPDFDEGLSESEDTDSPVHSARQRLRSVLEIQHMCIFFMANIYFQIKSDEEKIKPNSDEFSALEKKETDAYEEAKEIRAELLKEVVHKFNHTVRKIASKDVVPDLVKIPKMGLDLEYSGIESRKVYEKLYKLCESMNDQAEQLEALRQKMVDFLKQALIDEEEEIELQGDEYENSTRHQDEMYAIMEVLRALYADRGEAITGQENTLIRNEMKAFLKLAKEGEGPAPELLIRLLQERESKKIDHNEQGSLRGIVAELRALLSSLQWSDNAGQATRAKVEMQIAEEMLQHTTKLLTAQNKALLGLEQEAAHFRNSMNARLEYYKALQKISDTVAPYREEDIGEPLDSRQLNLAVREEADTHTKCSSLLAKKRYLLHIQQESKLEAAQRICIICQSEFELGAITSCGHVFCKEDIQLWYAQSSSCPVCKTRLRAADFFDITYKPTEMTVQAEDPSSPDSDDATSGRAMTGNSIYSDVSTRQLNEIKDIEIRGSGYGSKVDTICRHLLWLRDKDAGAKTLVFSQFSEVLDILGRAFRQNGILYSKCDDKGGIQDFKTNPAVEVFLLHAKAHSAGLNLVVASHVILCEPLINTAIELQAIARVHRIGQHRATTVWMYLVASTVEESIYDISVKRRLEHMKNKGAAVSRSGSQTPALLQESAIEAANSRELQAADLRKALTPGRQGGEMVDKEDLWPCLFGHVVGGNGGTGGGGLGSLSAGSAAVGANNEIGRFLRADAAETRRDG